MGLKILVETRYSYLSGSGFNLPWDIGGALEEDYGFRDGGHSARVSAGGDPLDTEATGFEEFEGRVLPVGIAGESYSEHGLTGKGCKNGLSMSLGE